MDSIIGKDILGYKVIEKIGTGGFGDVYKVERNNIVGNVTRALKVITLPKESQYMEILNSMGGDSEKADNYFRQELDRVVNEIRVFSMISEKDNHNIVSYYENDVQKDGKYKYNIYILMEMLTPLDKWLAMNNLTVEQALDIGLGVANALKICHENNVMHRDIKVNNIFVSKDGKFKLGDFGVSKQLDMLTRANTIKGTPHYIAPEVYMGKSDYDNSVDIYSLGILLYCLFNKRRFPFYPNFPMGYTQVDEDRAFYKRMSYENMELPICAPEEIGNIILKSISKPDERYGNAVEFINDLEAVKAKLDRDTLDEKIGFESINYKEYTAMTKKENDLVANLEGDDSNSISFGQYTMETLNSKNTFRKVLGSKKLSVALLSILVLVVLTGGIAIGTHFLNDNQSVVTSGGPEKDTTEVEIEMTDNQNENGATNNHNENGVANNKNGIETTINQNETHKAESSTIQTTEPVTTAGEKMSTKTSNSNADSKDEDFEFEEIVETENNQFGFDDIVE